jgi:hypothetical protein
MNPMLEPHARPFGVIFRNKLYALGFERPLNFPEGISSPSYLSGSFEASDSGNMYQSDFGQIGLVHAQQSASGPKLGSVNHADLHLTYFQLNCYI